MKPVIERFTSNSIVFSDNTLLTHIDTVVLATGYKFIVPFLTEGGYLQETSNISRLPDDKTLRTNARYIWPLWQHMLSLDPRYPLGSLYFMSIASITSAVYCGIVQTLFALHTIADPSLLQSRDTFFSHLLAQEDRLRAKGIDPDKYGHSVYLNQGSNAYYDEIVGYLQERGLGGMPEIPPLGQSYSDSWRVFDIPHILSVVMNWLKVESRGEDVVRQWLEGVETEDQWVALMDKLVDLGEDEI